MASKKVLRQIKRAFSAEDPEAFLALPENQAIVQFVEGVERSYTEYEDRLKMAERNLDISSNELHTLNTAINSMIDSLGEGYFVVGSDGVCRGVYSRVCEQIFGAAPSGRHLFELFQIPEADRPALEDWLALSFTDRLSDDDVVDLGPQIWIAPEGQTFKIKYRRVFENEEVKGLVVVATDRTKEIEAVQMAQVKIDEARVITKLAQDRMHFQTFMRAARETLEWLKTAPADKIGISQARFDLHTLKGGAATFYLTDLENVIHDVEIRLVEAERSKKRIDLAAISQELDDKLSEIITRHSQILGKTESWMDEVHVDRKTILELWEEGCRQQVPRSFLDRMLDDTLSADVKSLMQNFTSTVQMTANRLNKPVLPLDIAGDTFKIPFEPYRDFFATLVHLFRNSVDHGIESKEVRFERGKSPFGKIEVRVGLSHLAKEWWIEVTDDGNGVDCAALRKKIAVQLGEEQAKSWSDQQVMNMLLEHSLSSRETATKTSGMGIGLSAVGAAIRKLGGRWQVQSQLGVGTTFTFNLPHVRWTDILQSPVQAPMAPANDESAVLHRRYNDLISEMKVMFDERLERIRLNGELEVARALQKAVVPDADTEYRGFAVSGRSFVAGSCNGDWWFHSKNGDSIMVWVGDATGHGVGSALLATSCRAAVQILHASNPDTSVAESLALLNDIVYSLAQGEVYSTAYCVKLNTKTGEMEVGSAGHPPSLHFKKEQDADAAFLDTPLNYPLGAQPGSKFETSREKIQAGETLFLMTDGLSEIPTLKANHWSERKLLQFLNRSYKEKSHAKGLIEDLEGHIFSQASGQMADDVTFVAVTRLKAS